MFFKYLYMYNINNIHVVYKNIVGLSTDINTVGEKPITNLDIIPTPNNKIGNMVLLLFLNIAYNEITTLLKMII